eukprot:2982585-Rhodomonas_salina.1
MQFRRPAHDRIVVRSAIVNNVPGFLNRLLGEQADRMNNRRSWEEAGNRFDGACQNVIGKMGG